MSYSETISSDLRPYVKLAMKDTLSDKEKGAPIASFTA